ncbi:methylated-DNA--[protein]-cysteine S-methyltransferase [Risungbinella massiliensis]|uniref:methylated-DNA--[protein]-cysteine S-methyltransferase n=1 Tax=Risungbinella massiliensis TaxID=1329796 RepID=UPI0005CBA182|nr:methylated-DNA--[protein]-cysteine S-methyltransferase [Risungbinella massiliensis]
MMSKPVSEIYWGTFQHPLLLHPLHLAVTNQGLCRITWPHETIDVLKKWVNRRIPNAFLIQNHNQLSKYVQQLQEYFDGDRKKFTLPLDLRGTAFQTSVWQALTQIPYGQAWSYSDIAERIDNPKAVRAVGTANGANPIPIVIPCHRVIGKNATLTGFRGGLDMKEKLLQLEGYYDYTKKGHARFQF